MTRERGVAAIPAILIVAVAASVTTFMLAQQSAMLDQTALVASRAQADLYLDAGVDWARGVLSEDARRGANVDALGDGWAQPIVGLPVERAVVSGVIHDEQGKFNVNNLVAEGRNESELRVLQRILKEVGLAPELGEALMDWMDADDDLTGSGGAENAHYLSLRRPYRAANQRLVQIDELYRVRGFDAAAIARLRPHLTALPDRARTPVNVNTASAVVLAALLDGKVPRDRIAERLAVRAAKPFRSPAEIAAWAPRIESQALSNLAVKSDYFSVRVQVAQDDVQVASEALIQRNPQNAATAIVWRRPLY
jgi:general secretion pathway protein K